MVPRWQEVMHMLVRSTVWQLLQLRGAHLDVLRELLQDVVWLLWHGVDLDLRGRFCLAGGSLLWWGGWRACTSNPLQACAWA